MKKSPARRGWGILIALILAMALIGVVVGIFAYSRRGIPPPAAIQASSRLDSLKLDGRFDTVILEVEGHQTQTNSLMELQQYTTTLVFSVANDGDTEITGTLWVSGGVTFAGSVRVINIDATGYVSATSSITSATTLAAGGLTSGRVPFATTGGQLTDDADLTFATDTLTATKIGAFTLSGKLTAGASEVEGSDFDIDGGDVSAATISGGLTWNAAQDLNDQNLTNADIDSGAFDGVTIGAASAGTGRFTTLDATSTISATGNITSHNTIYGVDYFAHVGDADTFFGSDTDDAFTLQAGGEQFIDVTEDGSQDIIEIGDDGDIDIKLSAGVDGALFVEGSSGNVGIGTTGPGTILDIEESVAASYTMLTHSNTAAGDTGNRVLLAQKVKDDGGTLGSAFQLVSSFNNIGAATKNSQVDFQTQNANTWGTVMTINGGNVGIGTTGPEQPLHVAGNALITDTLIMETAPTTPTMAADTAGFFVADTDGSAEMWVMDEADNATQLSPHSFPLFDPDDDEAYPWSYYACNRYLGKCINVDIAGAIRAIEELSGQQFIYYKNMDETKIVSWDEQQEAYAVTVNAQRLAEAAAVLTPTLQADAVESYAETITQPVSPTQYVTETIVTYTLNEETGEVEEVITYEVSEVTEMVETGKTLWRSREGCQIEESTGAFLCPVGEANAVYEPYVPQPMPEWMAKRFETLVLAPQDLSGIEKPEGGEYRKLVDIGPQASLWIAKSHESEALLDVHNQLWELSPAGTLGLLAAVKESGQSFYDKRVRIATDMSVADALARRNRIADYLDSLGKDTTALRQATTEHQQVAGIVDALGLTMSQLWGAME